MNTVDRENSCNPANGEKWRKIIVDQLCEIVMKFSQKVISSMQARVTKRLILVLPIVRQGLIGN